MSMVKVRSTVLPAAAGPEKALVKSVSEMNRVSVADGPVTARPPMVPLTPLVTLTARYLYGAPGADLPVEGSLEASPPQKAG